MREGPGRKVRDRVTRVGVVELGIVDGALVRVGVGPGEHLDRRRLRMAPEGQRASAAWPLPSGALVGGGTGSPCA